MTLADNLLLLMGGRGECEGTWTPSSFQKPHFALGDLQNQPCHIPRKKDCLPSSGKPLSPIYIVSRVRFCLGRGGITPTYVTRVTTWVLAVPHSCGLAGWQSPFLRSLWSCPFVPCYYARPFISGKPVWLRVSPPGLCVNQEG